MEGVSWILLKITARSILHLAGVGGVWALVAEDLPSLAREVYERWCREREAKQRPADVQEVIAQDNDFQEKVPEIVEEVAGDQPESTKQELREYLSQLPNAVRRTMRRPSDPAGVRTSAALMPKSSEDIIPWLDLRKPRFSEGLRLPGTDWVLDKPLGGGGYGEVWLARHVEGTLDPVAIKFGEELRREAALCARVMKEARHPGIATLRNTYFGADPPFVEYEYVAGGELSNLIRGWHAGTDRPSARAITTLFLQIVDTMSYVHRLDPPIVHRDLKPANILVVKEGNAIRFKITDFGISGVASTALVKVTRQGTNTNRTLSRSVSGSHSALYASPEQALGSPPDPRDDVHALGVIWYQMLTGCLTEGRQSGEGWKEELEKLELSPDLIKVLGSCFEKPARRSADAGVLAASLREAFHDRHDTAGVCRAEAVGVGVENQRNAVASDRERGRNIGATGKSTLETPSHERSAVEGFRGNEYTKETGRAAPGNEPQSDNGLVLLSDLYKIHDHIIGGNKWRIAASGLKLLAFPTVGSAIIFLCTLFPSVLHGQIDASFGEERFESSRFWVFSSPFFGIAWIAYQIRKKRLLRRRLWTTIIAFEAEHPDLVHSLGGQAVLSDPSTFVTTILNKAKRLGLDPALVEDVKRLGERVGPPRSLAK